jgi:phytoene dehydrogenase-like protein
MLDGQFSGIEVTELVHRPTLERSIKAVRQRARGEEPGKHEAYFNWSREEFVGALQKLLDVKNSKPPPRTYERYVIVIHTAEFFLDSGTVERFLQGARFRSGLITRAFLGLQYEPAKGYPVFELKLVRE